ncbi:hypothetical protein K2X30_14505 [bacterium]|jgi:hypothetical protein|nr:hypothetical protein [bacterium]
METLVLRDVPKAVEAKAVLPLHSLSIQTDAVGNKGIPRSMAIAAVAVPDTAIAMTQTMIARDKTLDPRFVPPKIMGRIPKVIKDTKKVIAVTRKAFHRNILRIISVTPAWTMMKMITMMTPR